MTQVTRTELNVSPRQVLGKKVKRLRWQGLTPANIYGHRVESTAIQVPSEELRRVLQTVGRSEIIYLRLDGEEPRPAFIRAVQRDPLTDGILHVDFYQISLLEKVRMDVPLHLVGEAPAVEQFGGTLLHSLDYVTVDALPTDIPAHIEVDVSRLEEIDQALHIRDLPVPPSVTVLTDPDLVVAKVVAPAVERVEEVAEEAIAEVEAAREGREEEGKTLRRGGHRPPLSI